MTSRTLRATPFLLLPLLLFLPQCKPKDPTPPLPKVTALPAASMPVATIPPSRTSRHHYDY